MDGNSSIPILMAWPASGLNLYLIDSIKSLLQNADHYGHRINCIISFDRPFNEILPSLVEQIEALSSSSGNRIFIYDSEKQSIIKKILSERVESGILDYALDSTSDGIGYGSNINANLLRSAGKMLISTDDDIICQPARFIHQSDKSENIIIWSDEFYPGEMYSYKERESLLNNLQKTEIDIIKFYKAHLGQSTEALHLPSMNKTIVTACPGIYGNSWMSSQYSFLNLKGESRKHLMRNYSNLRFSRDIIRIPRQYALSASTQFIMAQSGFDNRLPIPPLLSYGRNAEGLSHFLLRLIYPDSCTVYPDFGLYHSPQSEPELFKDSLTDYKPHLSSLVMGAAMYHRPGKEIKDTNKRYRILGSGIEEIGRLPSHDFTEAVHSALSAGLRNYAVQLQEALDSYDREPALWAEDVDRHLESVRTLLEEPQRMFGSEGCGLSVERAQFHFRNYGRLLTCWPALHCQAASMNLLD